MNWVDLAVIGIIALSAVFAFARGFVREALSIVAWVGAAFITFKGFDWAFARIEPHVHNPLLSQVIAGFGLFVLSLVVLTMITGTLARLVHASFLTPVDRTLGFIFGLARGAFLVCLAYLLLDLSVQSNDQPPWIRNARSTPYLHAGADMLKGFVPESLKNKAAEDMMKSLGPSPATEAEEAKSAPLKPSAPAKAETVPAPPSYPTSERRQLDRVIQNQR